MGRGGAERVAVRLEWERLQLKHGSGADARFQGSVHARAFQKVGHFKTWKKKFRTIAQSRVDVSHGPGRRDAGICAIGPRRTSLDAKAAIVGVVAHRVAFGHENRIRSAVRY